MQGEGNIRKLKSGKAAGDRVEYHWAASNILDPMPLLPLERVIGDEIRIEHTGKIHCTVTGKSIRKTYGDGMSFDAFQSSPLAVESIIHPELSRIHETAGPQATERNVRDEALDIPVAVGELLAFVCEATSENSPGGERLTENEKRRYFELRGRVAEELMELDTAVEQEGTLRRAVKSA